MPTASKRVSNPYKRFTLVLAVLVLLISGILSITVVWGVNKLILGDTVDLTKAAVIEHFFVLPGFSDTLGSSDSEDASHDHDSDTVAAENGSDDPILQNYDNTLKIVQMHFGLYSIVDARLYSMDGEIRFSYQRDEINQKLPAVESFNEAHNGETVSSRDENELQIWVPIRNDEGQVSAVLEVNRDISKEQEAIRSFQLIITLVILVGALILFFSLRQVFIRSAKIIDTKNKELRHVLNTVERTYDESLQALSAALDSRDNETQGHAYRVTTYAVQLGRHMGLNEKELGSLARGALLHDVGKIGVPDSILRKPGKLTEEEWVIMRNHVHIGYQMLSHIEFLGSSLDVVKYHHERWDGNGYPYSLKGNGIPLCAAIFSLCDTYDAMTSDRPYRKGKSYTEVREEIVRNSGTQLNPQVVQAFLSIPEEEWKQVTHSEQCLQSERLIPAVISRLDAIA